MPERNWRIDLNWSSSRRVRGREIHGNDSGWCPRSISNYETYFIRKSKLVSYFQRTNDLKVYAQKQFWPKRAKISGKFGTGTTNRGAWWFIYIYVCSLVSLVQWNNSVSCPGFKIDSSFLQARYGGVLFFSFIITKHRSWVLVSVRRPPNLTDTLVTILCHSNKISRIEPKYPVTGSMHIL
jgi:hypothetical protein